jgi:hypothetical protein
MPAIIIAAVTTKRNIDFMLQTRFILPFSIYILIVFASPNKIVIASEAKQSQHYTILSERALEGAESAPAGREAYRLHSFFP